MSKLTALLVASAINGDTTLPLTVECADFNDVKTILSENFKEKPSFIGLSNDNTTLIVFSSISGETFTVIKVNPKGVGCVVDHGVSLEDIREVF